MANYLVIVESSAKVETIKKFLDTNHGVSASRDHIRDLPKSQLGFDAGHDYGPKYIIIREKGDVLAKLREEVKRVDKIYLTTDPDREGEAISWHLMKTPKLDELRSKDVCRISFGEITENVVKTSFKTPRELDMNLANTQQTKRMLDRMMGYRISPLLWAKVRRGLNAGRIQSAAPRMAYDRGDEVNAFIPEEYWSLEADFLLKGNKKPLVAEYYGTGDPKGGKTVIHNKEGLSQTLSQLEEYRHEAEEVKRGERVKKAPIPSTTSTLQRETSKALNFPIQKTIRLAQQLYEGVEVKDKGTLGLITYLRTDSARIADEADTAARAFVKEHYDRRYAAQGSQAKKEGTKIQDTREIVCPTDITLTPTVVKESLQGDLLWLYQLIWKRFTVDRMAPAVYETTSVRIGADDHLFTTSISELDFEGFVFIYMKTDDGEEKDQVLDNLEKGAVLKLKQLDPSQYFTQPPVHYTEISLVKILEEQGIGRPSTYAPTIIIIIARRYVVRESKNLYVTEPGDVINRIIKNSFPSIVDPNLTANVESLLDKVANSTIAWKTVISNFYPDLDEAIKTAGEELESVKIADEVPDVVCDLRGRQMVIKYGPHGKFLACPRFPECKNTKPYLEKIGIPCPRHGRELVRRKTKRGRLYYRCEASPDCDFISWQRPSTQRCPVCRFYMVEKGNKLLCAGETYEYRMGKTEKQKNL